MAHEVGTRFPNGRFSQSEAHYIVDRLARGGPVGDPAMFVRSALEPSVKALESAGE